MTSPDETSERSAASGTTRTPPPRTRRGAPTTRGAFAELDALDALVPAESDDNGQEPLSDEPRTGARTSKPEATSEPAAATAFDWADDAHPPDETVLGAAAAGSLDPLVPEVSFESPSTRPARPKPVKRPERRFRQTVQKVDLWSVTKMALCFYVSAMGVVIVSLVALWLVADSAGIIDNVENFIGDLFSSEDFQFVSGEVLRGTVLVSVVFVALMVAFTIIAASFYNIFAELFGGVEIVIREEEQPPKR